MTAASTTAGLLVHRAGEAGVEVLLAHPGGPWWSGRDRAAWSIPKGLVETGEPALAAAAREFTEETGLAAPVLGQELTPRRLPGGKLFRCWLASGSLDLDLFRSGLFEMEWPPRSGRMEAFPEVDRIAFFGRPEALIRIHAGQRPVLEEAFDRLGTP